LLDTEGINLITNLKICFAAVTPHFFVFPATSAAVLHTCRNKIPKKTVDNVKAAYYNV